MRGQKKMNRVWQIIREHSCRLIGVAVLILVPLFLVFCEPSWWQAVRSGHATSWWQAVTAGYVVSIAIGGVAVPCFHWLMQRTLPRDAERLPPRWKWLQNCSSDITGFIERFVFTTLMVANPEAALVGMGVWLGAKMAATWGRDIATDKRDDKLFWASHAFLALQTGFVSMAFAGVGGAYARYLYGLTIIP